MEGGKVTALNPPGIVPRRSRVLFQASSGQIYVGGRSGLFLWRGGEQFTPVEGMPDQNVAAMAEDGHGRIVVATENGICELREGGCVADRIPDSLKKFTAYALFAEPDGGLWAGGLGHIRYWRGGETRDWRRTKFTASAFPHW
jgi:ligand-binding sensor domain-containing protein